MWTFFEVIEGHARQGLNRFDFWTRGWFLLLFESLRDVLSFRSSLYAAATAYFTLFSIFPLVLLTVVIASFWFEPYLDGTEVLERFEFIVPAIDDLLGQNLVQIVDARGAISRLSAVILIWSASSVIYMMTRAMDAIWEGAMVRPAWRHRALAIIFTLILSVLLLIGSFIWGIIFPIVQRALPETAIATLPAVNAFASAFLSVTLFTLLYRTLPHASLQWRDVALGAVFAGLFWEVAKHAFLFFVTNYLTPTNLVYGSMATIIAFLTWAYISMLIFLYGGHVNVRYKQRREGQLIEAGQKLITPRPGEP